MLKQINVLAWLAAATLLTACSQQSDNATGGSETGDQSQTSGHARSSLNSNSNYDANNTGLNTRDRSGTTLTPEDQVGSGADRELARLVRRAITANEQLSTSAKNVKIMTASGKVTLRGPVNSEQEKQTVEGLVKNINGVTSVDNQLEVKTNQ